MKENIRCNNFKVLNNKIVKVIDDTITISIIRANVDIYWNETTYRNFPFSHKCVPHSTRLSVIKYSNDSYWYDENNTGLVDYLVSAEIEKLYKVYTIVQRAISDKEPEIINTKEKKCSKK